ncbi:MAG: MFS transporter [Chloroflexi bacterium]|nr:MFS transporter [Chloroflexota bacterium]
MSKRAMLFVSCVSFFALGWLAAVLGPALNDLAAQNDTDLSTIGSIFLLSFLGGLPAQAIAGMVSDRSGQRPVLIAGVLLLGLSAFGVAFSPALALTLGFSLVWGLGFGTLDIGHNVLIAELYAERVNVMNLLHVFFGVGAVVSPAAAGLSLELWDTALPAVWFGGGLMLLTLPFVLRLPRERFRKPDAPSSDRSKRFSYRVPLLWMFGAVMMVYVGVEIGVGGWAQPYLERTTTLSPSAAALATSGFWLALTASRMLIAVIGGRLTSAQVLSLSIGIAAAAGMLLAISTGSAALSIAAILVAGFGFGPVYPTIIVILTSLFPQAPGKAASVGTVMGGIGGGIIPWVQGILLDRVSTQASVIWIGAGTIIMLSLWLVARRATIAYRSARQQKPAPAA